MSAFARAVGMLCLGLALFTGGLSAAQAHKASDAFMRVQEAPAGPGLSMQLSVALRDLDAALDTLDADDNRALTWGEVRSALPRVQSWVAAGVGVRCDQVALPLRWQMDALERRSDGVYLRLAATSACPAPASLGLDYRLMQDIDATHRLLVSGHLGGGSLATVLAPQDRASAMLRSAVPGGSAAGAVPQRPQAGPGVFVRFFPEGLHHLATGYDHLAFLLALLLPIALGHQNVPGAAPASHRPGLVALVRTVTGFTLGHSLTLALATLGWIGSPPWVEPAIALTIGISALLNLYPVRWLRGDYLALGFGLIHGLGFSSLMQEAQVSSALLPWALAGFNVGIEAGQLLGVALWCALHLVWVRWRHYDRVVVRGGSWALSALAGYWVLTRLA